MFTSLFSFSNTPHFLHYYFLNLIIIFSYLAMDTTNIMIKKQILELMSAVLMYSENGYQLALDSLSFYKVSNQYI